MKTALKKLLLVAIGINSTAIAFAANYSVLHHFTGATNDGAFAHGDLIVAGEVLYGTTQNGGSGNGGTLFRFSPDGTSFALLNPSNGISSVAGLTCSGDVLYGVTFSPVSVFKINTDGSGFTVLKSVGPQHATGGLLLDGDTLYGVVSDGPGLVYPNNNGFVFKLSTDGTDYAIIHSFTANTTDGSMPIGGLVLSGTTLFGTTYQGGRYGLGTVYGMEVDGAGFTLLHSFAATNNEGFSPRTSLLLSGTTLYGTTSGRATLFRMEIGGSDFRSLHTFTGSDGTDPEGALALADDTLYGTTYSGGGSTNGTIFRMNTDGTAFAALYNFSGGDGANPGAGVALLGSKLYGTTVKGGAAGKGVLFALNTSTLKIDASGSFVTLRWSDPTFSLEAAPVLGGPYTNIPGALSPSTYSVREPQMFFRLRSN